jgi:hypothetical protein
MALHRYRELDTQPASLRSTVREKELDVER